MKCDVTHEELSRLSAGEVTAERARELERHVAACEQCRRRLESLREVDGLLRVMPREEPPAQAVLDARRALASELRSSGPEIMTLQEVAEFLRVSEDEMSDVAAELPAFEVGGRVRVRRARLLEWIEQRERSYMRASIQSEAARVIAGAFEEERT